MDRSIRTATKRRLRRAAVLFAFAAAPGLADPIHVPMQSVAAGTFYIEANVRGVGAVDFLVDTGSGYSTIDTRLLEALERSGGVEFVKQLEGIMADGSRRVVPVYRVPEIRLGACDLRNVEVAVFQAGTRPILGMRALSRVAPFTFSTNPPGMRLERCDSPGTDGAELAQRD